MFGGNYWLASAFLLAFVATTINGFTVLGNHPEESSSMDDGGLLEDTAGNIEFKVNAIHNISGYKRIRKELAKQQEYNYRVPNIQIIDCDLLDTRDLILGYKMSEGKELHEKDMDQVLLHVKQIWGYDIILELWKDGEKIGQKSTDAKKVESVKSTTHNPFAYGMFTNPGYI